jgi:hypothetical protein
LQFDYSSRDTNTNHNSDLAQDVEQKPAAQQKTRVYFIRGEELPLKMPTQDACPKATSTYFFGEDDEGKTCRKQMCGPFN